MNGVVYSDTQFFCERGLSISSTNFSKTSNFFDPSFLGVYFVPFGMLMPNRHGSSNESYRYGFNGQENVDEISGEGNHTTAEYWEYDTRLGRRWNQDPKPNPSISNYACFANNPIMYSDSKGDTIRLSGSTDALEAYKNEVEHGTGGNFTVQYSTSPDGLGYTNKIEFVSTGANNDISKEEKAFTKAYLKAVNSDDVVRQNVVINDSKVEAGGYQDNVLDMGDIRKFDNEAGGSSSAGVLIHETIEQLDKAKQGLSGKTTRKGYDRAHKAAMKVENKVNGNKRLTKMEDDRPGSAQYYKEKKSKGKVTVQNFGNDKDGTFQVEKFSKKIE